MIKTIYSSTVIFTASTAGTYTREPHHWILLPVFLIGIVYWMNKKTTTRYINRNLSYNWFFSCLPINWPIVCDRYCNKITTIGVNVFLRYGDYVHTGDCQRVIAYNKANGAMAHGETLAEPKQIWTDENSTNGIFMASCTTVTNLHKVEPFM